MKIVAPLGSVSQLSDLIKSGCDEIYTGILLKNKLNDFIVNRRPYNHGNLQSADELIEVIKNCHAKNIKVNLTLNSLYYTLNQYDYLNKCIELAVKADIDHIIVSDLGLILYLNKEYPNIPIIISTTSSCFNAESVKFFANLGNIKRVILPRHINIKELSSLLNNFKFPVEVFIYGQRCLNDDGQCNWDHFIVNFKKFPTSDGVGCHLNYKYKVLGKDINKDKICDKFCKSYENSTFCGFCYLYDFHKLGVDFLKIPGREDTSDAEITKRIIVIKTLKKLIKLLDNSDISREEFMKTAKEEQKKITNKDCRMSDCYY